MPVTPEQLKQVPLLAGLDKKSLARVAAQMRERHVSAGSDVVVQGESGVGFFVILEGRARVTQGGEDRGTLTAGDYFGEMALIDGDDRAASVVAEDALRCAAITMWNFRPFVKEHPDVAWSLLTAMVKRVREAQARRTVAAG